METFAFTVPCLALVVLTIYLPFVLSGFYSLTKWNGIAREPVFIGLGNFAELFRGDSSFVRALVFTGKYTALSMVILNVAALALAVALAKDLKSRDFLRSLFFVPYILSMTIVGFIWQFIFSKGFESFYRISHLAFLNLSWLGDVRIVFYSVVFVGAWQAVGFYVVLYVAGLQSIPADVLEAAVVDGASGPTKFLRITLPMLSSSIVTCVLLSMINSLKVFDTILALTKGGPAGSTYSATLEIYREAFQNNNYGLGSAKSLVFFLIVLALTLLVLRLFRGREGAA
jgi:raffinose/stachyose/melibiose transport system permease protein